MQYHHVLMISDDPTPLYGPHKAAKSRQVVHARPHNLTLRRLVKFSEFRPWRIIGPCKDFVVVLWGVCMLISRMGVLYMVEGTSEIIQICLLYLS